MKDHSNRRTRLRWARLLAIVLAFGLIAAACGSDDDGDAEEAPAATEAMADESMDDSMDDESMDDSMDDDMSDDMMDLSGTKVTVFGPESSDEEAGALRDALDHFAAQTGIEISYTGARDAADQINAQAAGGNPPDIFIFPQPGKLADFARDGHLIALPDDVIAAMNEHWTPAWTAFGDVDGTQYGIPNKSDLKSLVWYKPALFEELTMVRGVPGQNQAWSHMSPRHASWAIIQSRTTDPDDVWYIEKRLYDATKSGQEPYGAPEEMVLPPLAALLMAVVARRYAALPLGYVGAAFLMIAASSIRPPPATRPSTPPA